eukprot:m.31002 g.31002  ORF g.31002 m.31002 type:complete len:687 (-) comp16379_c0_seq1:239-2299(-)
MSTRSNKKKPPRFSAGSNPATFASPQTSVEDSERVKKRAKYEKCYIPASAAAARVAFPLMNADGKPTHPIIAETRILRNNFVVRTAEDLKASPIEEAFIGAVLDDCITIDSFVLAGGFGRGWSATFKDPEGHEKTIFVKTLGTHDYDAIANEAKDMTDYRLDCELKARVEAEIYLHPWFERAVNQPGVSATNLCYGSVKFPKQGQHTSIGNVFYIAGEFCEGGELWAYSVHKKSFQEKFARRLFGQLCRGLLVMKHCGQPELTAQHLRDVTTMKNLKFQGANKLYGAFHRDLKLENLMVNGNFDCKIIDCGSLKFSDSANVEHKFIEKADGTKIPVIQAHTAWVGTDCFKPPNFFYNNSSEVTMQGYDPASWDVWSAGVILLLITGADHIFSKIRGQVYKFMKIALEELEPSVRPGSRDHKLWKQMRTLMGGNGLFFDTDDESGKPLRVTKDGVPIIERDEKTGYPIYRRFWKWMDQCDPDANIPEDERSHEPFSPELKSLLNRMFDVDPEQRITIEEVCAHPWLQKHQAPDDSIPGINGKECWETETDRATFVSEMSRRVKQYVNMNERSRVFSGKNPTAAEVLEMVRDNIEKDMTAQQVNEANTRRFFSKPQQSNVVIEVTVKKVVSETVGAQPIPVKIFLVEYNQGAVKVTWSNSMYGCATLAEWHEFSEGLSDSYKDFMSTD